MSSDYVYFEGDPATDSARRHLERVLKNPRPPRRWPWVAASVAALAAWYFWPRGHGSSGNARDNKADTSAKSST